MRVLEAVKRVRSDRLALADLWPIANKAERVAIALILGLPGELPKQAATPDLAWRSLTARERRLVLAHAPPAIRARLPADPGIGRRIVWRPCRVGTTAGA